MRVVLGGGGTSSVESGTPAAEWLARMPWVARPAAACPLDPSFGVGEVMG